MPTLFPTFQSFLNQLLIRLTIGCLWCLFVVLDGYFLWVPYQLLCWILQQWQYRNASSPSAAASKNVVVIVGGNFSGLAALRELQDHPQQKNPLEIVVVDQRNYFEYTPGVLRLFCEPSHSSALARRHQTSPFTMAMSPKVRWIHGRVTGCNAAAKIVTYVDGSTSMTTTQLSYNALIWATGMSHTHPISPHVQEKEHHKEGMLEGRAQSWKAHAKRVQEARSILILGGGAVGTELAAELAHHYNRQKENKSITLVDASPKLVPLFAPAVSAYAEQWLSSFSVVLALGQRLQQWDDTSCTLQDGRVLKADIVFVCFGGRPNSGPMLLSSHDNDNHNNKAPPPPRPTCIPTDAHLRVKGQSHVFACGDVAAPPTEGIKQAFHAEVQGHVAAQNVLRTLASSSSSPLLLRYPQDASLGAAHIPMVYVLSLGPYDGVLGFNWLVVPGPLAAIVKWVIEYTKVLQMQQRPLGVLLWKLGDGVAFVLSKYVIRPVGGSATSKQKTS